MNRHIPRGELRCAVMWFGSCNIPYVSKRANAASAARPPVDWETMRSTIVDAEPEPIACDLKRTAVVIIDMQRDFLEASR